MLQCRIRSTLRPNSPKQGDNANYWILDTDYDNWSSVYFCYNTTDGNAREDA